jgi:large subunit ribosomal protein L29e
LPPLPVSTSTGIKKPKKGLKKSLKGMDPKFLRNQRYCKKHQATGRSEA